MRLRSLLCASAVVLMLCSPSVNAATDTVQTEQGEIAITPILHGSVQIEFGETVVQVDPWSRGDYSAAKKADLILITDVHGDHLDPDAIAAIRKGATTVVAPPAVAEQVADAIALTNGERRQVAGIEIEAIPMYNLRRGPEEGKLFHDKGRGNGYLLSWGGRRLYIAGDTECTPEMKALHGIDVAFVPMNLPYTMPPLEAAECVRAFRPRVLYPYHYRGSDLSELQRALADVEEVEVRLREWYPGS